MNSVFEKLKKEKVLFFDGSIGTELESRGFKLDHKLWSTKLVKTNPDDIKKLHLDYLKCGVDFITTCSYQVSSKGFIECGLPDNSKEYLHDSVKIARSAVKESGRNALVCCSLSCYGASMQDDGIAHEYDGEYVGKIPKKVIQEFHRKRLVDLFKMDEKSLPDVLLFESYPSLQEMMYIMEILQSSIFKEGKSPVGIGVFATFSSPDGKYTCAGEDFLEVSKQLEACDLVDCYGVNCTSPRRCLMVLKRMQSGETKPKKPLICRPNSGEEYDKSCELDEKGTDESCGKWKKKKCGIEDYKEYAVEFMNVGCDIIIGGCCRTNPKVIDEMIRTINDNKKVEKESDKIE